MKRRTFLSTLPVLAYSPFVLAQSGPLIANTTRSKYLDFDLSTHHKHDGSWILWVRAVLKGGDFRTDLPLKILIATDKSFSQIIAQRQIIAAASNSYIVTIHYVPKYPNTELYYKYIVDDAATLALAGKTQSVSSEIKTLSPWSSRD